MNQSFQQQAIAEQLRSLPIPSSDQLSCAHCHKIHQPGEDFRRSPVNRERMLCTACYWYEKRNGCPRPWDLIERDRKSHNSGKRKNTGMVSKPVSPPSSPKCSNEVFEKIRQILAPAPMPNSASARPHPTCTEKEADPYHGYNSQELKAALILMQLCRIH